MVSFVIVGAALRGRPFRFERWLKNTGADTEFRPYKLMLGSARHRRCLRPFTIYHLPFTIKVTVLP